MITLYICKYAIHFKQKDQQELFKIYPMFEIPVGVNKCWNAWDTFKNKGSLLFWFKFLIKNEYLIAGYRGS